MEDIAILEKPESDGPIANLPADVKANISIYYLNDANGSPQSFYLTEGDHSVIRFTENK